MNVRSLLEQQLGTAYRIERELGGGGMSHVFLAEEVSLGRRVVVKVLPPEATGGIDAERFKREIQLAASLQHPHIVTLLNTGAGDSLLWYSMPFVEGESLRAKLVREHELPVDAAVRIWREVLDALGYAHGRGLVHRDIKPENILMSGRHAVVTDFGVAKALSMATGGNMTSTGVSLGTPSYMAPEQATADPALDHRADIYAAGLVMYEMLVGHGPFPGLAPSQMMAAHAARIPESVATLRPNVPAPLASLVMRCLEKRPADRPQSADEVLTALETIVTPNVTTPVGALTPAKAAAKSRPWMRVVIGGVAVAAVVVAAIYAKRGPAAPTRVGPDPNDTTVKAIGLIDFDSDSADRRVAVAATEAVRDRMLRSTRLFMGTRQNQNELYRRAFDLDAGQLPPPDSVVQLFARLRAHAVLRGRVTRLGQSYVISVDAIRTDDRTPQLESFTVTAQDSTTLAKSIEQLGEKVTSGMERVAPRLFAPAIGGLASTGSLEALRFYQEGRRVGFGPRADFGASVEMYRQAVRVDSTFAPGWRSIANNLFNSGIRRSEAQTASARAFQERMHVRSWERALIEGTYYVQRNDIEHAIAGLAVGIQKGDVDAIHNTGIAYLRIGEPEIALPFLIRATARARTGTNPTSNLTATYLKVGRLREADSVIVRMDSTSPNNGFTIIGRLNGRLARRDYDAAIKILPLLAADDSAPPASGARLNTAYQNRSMEAIHGRMGAAGKATDAAAAVALAFQSPADALRERLTQIELDAAAGKDAVALKATLRELLRANPFSAYEPLDRPSAAAFRAWIALGEKAEAERVLAAWDKDRTGDAVRIEYQARQAARGELALGAGRAAEAHAAYREARKSFCRGCYLAGIARVFESQQKPDSAIANYEAYLADTDPGHFESDATELARTYRKLGELYEAKGDTKRAIQRYTDFVNLWKDADPDLQPKVTEIRERIAKLQKKSG